MNLHGKSIIAGEPSPDSEGEPFRGYDPALGQELEPPYYQASEADIARAFDLAERAVDSYRQKSPAEIAGFLEAIASQIEALGDELISRVCAETGLPEKRFIGERARTVGQLRMFAFIVREGSWVEATIDVAQPERQPLPKPDVRRMLIPIGPVVVFGASNFPLAFSVAGGDTASALAAGNPVIVKTHPAHPGTSELVASAIARAAEETGMPAGVFSLLHGTTPELALKLVRHPVATAIGFTGSLKAGRAIFDAAVRRPNPIPVYAEMGSVNPVFVLPGALRESGDDVAAGLHQSVTLGVGQLCTSPGLVVGLRDQAMNKFIGSVNQLFERAPAATMLHPGILRAYQDGLKRLGSVAGVSYKISAGTADDKKTEAQAAVFVTEAETFLAHDELGEEVFGPATLIVSCASKEEIMRVAHKLQGHLTATIHGTKEDLAEYKDLVELLQRKVGRLVFNGFPTGVEVCAAIHHGGPYPATTDVRSTSVGAYAIKRFARPICFQNFPQELLPVVLRDQNERGIWRIVDDKVSQEEIL
jgi:2,5-dioxopentanoate dehydrogenase